MLASGRLHQDRAKLVRHCYVDLGGRSHDGRTIDHLAQISDIRHPHSPFRAGQKSSRWRALGKVSGIDRRSIRRAEPGAQDMATAAS
jgi:hypothetical protein